MANRSSSLPPVHVPTVSEALDHERARGEDRGGLPWPTLALGRLEGTFEVRLRLLPDADEDNPTWWRHADRYLLPFRGTVDQPDQPVTVAIPSPANWGRPDPFRQRVFELRDAGRLPAAHVGAFLPQRFAAVAAFVREAPLDPPPEQVPHVLFLPWSAFDAMVARARDLGPTARPTDPDEGHDFLLVRSLLDDGRTTYGMSRFDPEPSPLERAERAAIREHGWVDLSRVIGEPPAEGTSAEAVRLLDACLAGELFDPGRFPWCRVRPAGERARALLVTLGILGGRRKNGDDSERRVPRTAPMDEPPRRRRAPAPAPEPEPTPPPPAADGDDEAFEDDPFAVLRARISGGSGR